MLNQKRAIIILSIALIVCLAFIGWQFFLSYQSGIYGTGYQSGYKQGVADSVIEILTGFQDKGYSTIVYNNQTVPVCICETQ